MFRRPSRGIDMGHSSFATAGVSGADSGMTVLLAQLDANASPLQRVLAGLLIAFSVAALFFALTRALKQMPIRPVFDYLRLGLQVGGVVIMASVVGISSEPQSLVVAAAVGLVVGLFQGNSLRISVANERVWAQRSRIGVAIWGASLIAMQIAGFANRAGIVKLGQVVAWFSVGITVGVLLGRGGHVREARAGLKPLAATVMLLVFVVGAPIVRGDVPQATAQESGVWVRGAGRLLGGTPVFPTFKVGLGVSGGSVDIVIAPNPATGGQGGTLPNSIVYGAPPAQLAADEVASVSASITPSGAVTFNENCSCFVQVIAGVDGRDLSGGLAATVTWSCSIFDEICEAPAPSSGTVSFSLGAGSSDGDTSVFYWRVQNCGPACQVEWVYTWQQAAPVATTAAPVVTIAPPVATTAPPVATVPPVTSAPPATAAPLANPVTTAAPTEQAAARADRGS